MGNLSNPPRRAAYRTISLTLFLVISLAAFFFSVSALLTLADCARGLCPTQQPWVSSAYIALALTASNYPVGPCERSRWRSD